LILAQLFDNRYTECVTTRYLQLAQHHATGVTLTDVALRFMVLTQHGDSVLPEHYGIEAVPEGCLSNGAIVDRGRFIAFLKKVRKTHKLDRINLVLDSAQILTLTLSVKGAAPMYVRDAIEKEFGLPAKDLIYDYHAVAAGDDTTVMQVTGMAKAVSQDFLTAFKSAGLTVLTIESVGHALNRDLLPPEGHESVMVLSIDTTVTSATFVVNGRVAQTTHFAFGDSNFIAAIAEKMNVTVEQAQRLKEERGILIGESRVVFDAVADDCVALVHHINELYIAWRTAHPVLPQLESIYVTGPGSLLKGLGEYISTSLRVPVQPSNVWVNCFSFDHFIPNLKQGEATQYGPAIGAVLVGGHAVNLLPYAHQKSIQRKRVAKNSGKVVLSFILGVIVGFAVARVIAIPTVHTKITDVLHKIQARW
jgi:type IV pilus assembly protein PilM